MSTTVDTTAYVNYQVNLKKNVLSVLRALTSPLDYLKALFSLSIQQQNRRDK